MSRVTVTGKVMAAITAATAITITTIIIIKDFWRPVVRGRSYRPVSIRDATKTRPNESSQRR